MYKTAEQHPYMENKMPVLHEKENQASLGRKRTNHTTSCPNTTLPHFKILFESLIFSQEFVSQALRHDKK